MPKKESEHLNQSKAPWGPVAAILIAVFIFFGSQILVAIILREYVDLRHWSIINSQ